MNWENLYSSLRTGSEHRQQAQQQDDVRTSFLRDYDRIIFSSAFRRLQNKTQVFPLPGAVLVHNRLTHSLEVASVGRSLGKAVGDKLAQLYNRADERFQEFYRYELASVIAAACLAHDIGNPPFGHSGEDAIRSFFKQLAGDEKQRFVDSLSDVQQQDFLKFEGNANAFRTLTHDFNEQLGGGFRLTYATLASIVKYPCDSLNGFNKALLVTKKSGFFQAEAYTFKQIADALGLPELEPGKMVYARHPFVFLVEAADDICYRVIDFEDAHRLGIISTAKIKELLLAFFSTDEQAKAEKTLDSIRDENQKMQYLRAKVINHLATAVTDIFLQQEEALLEGSLNKPLIDLLPADQLAIIKQIDEYSYKHIYNYRSVVEIEIAGYNVIGALLKEYYAALIDGKSQKSRKLLQLVSRQYVITGKQEDFYNDLLSIVDFISGMTDLYAVDMYRKITGINISS